MHDRVAGLEVARTCFILVQPAGPLHNDHATNLTMHVSPSSESAISFVEPSTTTSHETVNRQSGGQFFVHSI